jgi:hypothetical protein
MEEQKEKKLKTHQKISKILFVIFLILSCLSLLFYRIQIVSIPIIFRKLLGVPIVFFEFLFFPSYIIYIIIATAYVLKSYKKFLFFNLIAICLITIFFVLNVTDFCFKKGRYLNQQEIVDAAFKRMVETCKKEHKNECLIYEDIQQKYSQCFNENISDECIAQEGNNKYFTVYRIEKNYTYFFPASFFFPGFQSYFVYTDIAYRKINLDFNYPEYLTIYPCERGN